MPIQVKQGSMATGLLFFILTRHTIGVSANTKPAAAEPSIDAWQNVGHPALDDHVGPY